MEINFSSSSSSSSSSPSQEFSFSVCHSHQQPHLLTADELFLDGVLRPLHLLSISKPQPDSSVCSSSSSSSEPSLSVSKKWRELFKKKDRRTAASAGNGASAELNINIWPFSRSRSAGNNAAVRPKPGAAAMRKSSSAPCSRSGSRRWAASPARPTGGVHVGRPGSVWHVRRHVKGGGKSEGLSSNANSCIGYGRRREGVRNEGFFKIRALFAKKVY